MSWTGWLLLGALGALLFLHMAKPWFERRRLSAAPFFRDLPPPKTNPPVNLALGNPLRSRPLYPQLLFLALAALALLGVDSWDRDVPQQLGLWILLDTSASMTTLQDGDTRFAAARSEVRRVLDSAADRTGPQPLCLRLSTFDQEVRTLGPSSVDRAAFEHSLESLEPRMLGTDLGLLWQLASASPGGGAGEGEEACPVQYRVVVTDLPAPDWIGGLGPTWIWRDVGREVGNAGIVGVTPIRDSFGGRTHAVEVEVAAYGMPLHGARLRLVGPDPSRPVEVAVEGSPSASWRTTIGVSEPGIHRLLLSPGGAYGGDDEAVLLVPGAAALRVDWRLGSTDLPRRFGWRLTAEDPELTVIALGEKPPAAPTLIVGDQYGRGPPGQIGFFAAESQLLAGLSFDVAETARIRGVSAFAGFDPVLTGTRPTEDVWVAQRGDPPAVYLPGLPTGDDTPVGHFSQVLFVRALRWLLAGSAPPPLYTLTSPAAPRPQGSRIALHEGEGKTDHPNLSRGDVDVLRPVSASTVGSPYWPWWLAAAAAVFFVEQLLLAYGGKDWR